jgi:hypothetical protein
MDESAVVINDLEAVRPLVWINEIPFAAMQELFRDILPVRKVGQTHIWFTPWDYLIRWWGLQEAMLDLVERPDLVNAAVQRMTDAWMVELDQLEAQNLLSLDSSNTRIGSGGYGYTSGLPGKPFDPAYVLPHNMWGCSNAQIFSDVSPDMHWEFALRHDLRKGSMSPWNDFDRAVREIGADYVFSFKPSPAVFAEESWRPRRARADLVRVLDKTRRVCHVEIIMKDISTVRYRPQQLWEWARIAVEVAQEYAP